MKLAIAENSAATHAEAPKSSPNPPTLPRSISPMPDTPVATDPEDWPHYPLWKRVRQAVLAAPDHFETNIHLEGIHATDLHTLNDPLAASIEEIFVATLNRLHHAWDPDLRYERHAFVHQPRTFPNVILRQQQHGAQPLMGIEVKTWHLLAREQAPSCRFTANRGSPATPGTSSPSCPGVSRTSFPARRSSSGPSSSPPSTAPGSETTTGSTNEQPRRIPESASPPGSRPILPGRTGSPTSPASTPVITSAALPATASWTSTSTPCSRSPSAAFLPNDGSNSSRARGSNRPSLPILPNPEPHPDWAAARTAVHATEETLPSLTYKPWRSDLCVRAFRLVRTQEGRFQPPKSTSPKPPNSTISTLNWHKQPRYGMAACSRFSRAALRGTRARRRCITHDRRGWTAGSCKKMGETAKRKLTTPTRVRRPRGASAKLLLTGRWTRLREPLEVFPAESSGG